MRGFTLGHVTLGRYGPFKGLKRRGLGRIWRIGLVLCGCSKHSIIGSFACDFRRFCRWGGTSRFRCRHSIFCGPVRAFKASRGHKLVGSRSWLGCGLGGVGRGCFSNGFNLNFRQNFCRRLGHLPSHLPKYLFGHLLWQNIPKLLSQGRSSGGFFRFDLHIGQGISFGRWYGFRHNFGQYGFGFFGHGRKQLVRFTKHVFFGQKFCQFDGGLVIILRVIVHERQQHAALRVCIHCLAGHDRLLLRIERKRFLMRQRHLNIGCGCGHSMIVLGQIGQQRTLGGRIIAKKVG